jgi:hypothetical protein
MNEEFDIEELQDILNIVMDHMVDAMRLACVEKGRRRCLPCVMSLVQFDVDEFFKKNTPATMEELGVNEYMGLVVRWSRKIAMQTLKKVECREIAPEDFALIVGNTTCH